MRPFVDNLLSIWFLSWLAIVGAFLYIGFQECSYEFSRGTAAFHFSLTLLIITLLLWVVYFVADDKACKLAADGNSWDAIVVLRVAGGTILVVVTLLGI